MVAYRDHPDLGQYNSDKVEPVDFGIWQAADGTWQVWSCIRGSKFPGSPRTTRFLYGWEGKSLTDKNWAEQGIKWVADPSLGETPEVCRHRMYSRKMASITCFMVTGSVYAWPKAWTGKTLSAFWVVMDNRIFLQNMAI